MRELESCRREIDEIDAELVRLFERRMGVCRDVALYKQAHYMDILNAAREEAVLKSRAQQAGDPALAQSVMALFTEIMRLSREEQRRYLEAQTQTRLIAYSGVPGAYSECAVVGFFGEDCERVSFKTFDEVFAAVADAVRAIGYTGAGTLEFLRDPDGNLWFMEMNVRLPHRRRAARAGGALPARRAGGEGFGYHAGVQPRAGLRPVPQIPRRAPGLGDHAVFQHGDCRAPRRRNGRQAICGHRVAAGGQALRP